MKTRAEESKVDSSALLIPTATDPVRALPRRLQLRRRGFFDGKEGHACLRCGKRGGFTIEIRTLWER